MYFVWDDGASRHMGLAQRLHKHFRPRIDFYRDAALKFHIERYEKDVIMTKEKGWDSALIRKPTAYHYYSYK